MVVHASGDVNDKNNVARGSLHRPLSGLGGGGDSDDDAFITGEGMDLDGGLRRGGSTVVGSGALFPDGEGLVSVVVATVV